MMSIKALARTTWILIVVVIILAAGLIGTVVYFTYRPPPAAAPEPEFVTNKVFKLEGTAAFEWLDPHVSYYMFDYFIMWHSVEMLYWYNGSSSTQVIPWLAAEAYTKNPAGTQYSFTLRSGIKFQDGTPFNSTAVWFSMNRILVMDGTSGDPAKPVHGSQAAWIIQQMLNTNLSTYFTGDQPYDAAWVQEVLAQNFIERDPTDPLKFKMNILNPTTQFDYLISMPWAAIVSPTAVIKKDYEYHTWPFTAEQTPNWNYTRYFERMAGIGDTYFNLPEQGWKIGTGPYTIESVDPDTYNIVMKANPDYWGGPPGLEFPIQKARMIPNFEYIYQPALATRLLDMRAEKATGIAVAPLDIFSVVDRDKWINEQTFVSLIPRVDVKGPLPIDPVTVWFNFCTNVTDPGTGKLKTFQPLADIRFRKAIASSVNMTDMNINVNNRLGLVAQNLNPPDTFPEGSYNPNIKPAYTYDLAEAERLLVDAWLNPMKSSTHVMTYYNGSRIPAGVVDNSFSIRNPKTIEMYVPAGATHYERVLTVIAENLNRIAVRTYNTTTGARSTKPGAEQLGLTFTVVPVPGGQQYTLASRHEIYMYWGGWHADYNHVLNWLGPMLLSTGTYFSWNLWNITALDNLYFEAIEADAAGNMTRLVEISNEMNRITNELVLYLWLWHPMPYFVRSTWLKGWYYNPMLGAEYIAPMYYESP